MMKNEKENWRARCQFFQVMGNVRGQYDAVSMLPISAVFVCSVKEQPLVLDSPLATTTDPGKQFPCIA